LVGVKLVEGLGVSLGVGLSESEVDVIDLNSRVNQFFEGVDVANEGEGTLDLRL
jgi:hypothetical protein